MGHLGPWVAIVGWVFALTVQTAFAEGQDPRARAELWLETMGGRTVWAEARTVHSWAVNHNAAARLVYTQEYWMDLSAPHQLVRIKNYDFDRLRGYTPEAGFSIVEGTNTPFSAERLARDKEAWERTLHRKLHLLASAPDALVLSDIGNGRVGFALDGEDLGWVEIGADGALLSSKTQDADEITKFEPLVAFGPINWPAAGALADGSWSFEVLAIAISPEPPPVSFQVPEDLTDLDQDAAF